MGLEECEIGLRQPDAAVEVQDAGLGLSDELLLGRNLIIQRLDQPVNRVNLRLDVLDLMLDVR